MGEIGGRGGAETDRKSEGEVITKWEEKKKGEKGEMEKKRHPIGSGEREGERWVLETQPLQVNGCAGNTDG